MNIQYWNKNKSSKKVNLSQLIFAYSSKLKIWATLPPQKESKVWSQKLEFFCKSVLVWLNKRPAECLG